MSIFYKTGVNKSAILLDGGYEMNTKVAVIGFLAVAFTACIHAQSNPGQAPSSAVIVSGSDAKWAHEAGDPPDTEAVVLRMDQANGSMELLVRFPGGHVFKPHWHEANERIIVLEGRLAIGQGDQQVQVDAGGYAFLPAREIQYLTCSSKTRCTMYLGWDGKFASHNPPVAK
jgi:quercetin dioxygenase-like cupin family protein